MITSKKRITAVLFATLSLFTLGIAGFAQRHFMIHAPRPEVNVVLSAAVERNSEIVSLEKAAVVNPGEVLDWTVTSQNSGNASAFDYKTIAHIPRGTSYIAGTARADGAKAVFSIDGGKSFWEMPTIEEKQPDGSVKRVPAPIAMYTDIRYEWSDPLVQGGKLFASYKVRVK